VEVFSSNVQPKRRMRQQPAAWCCACGEPGGAYKLNLGYLERCPTCGVARQSSRVVPGEAPPVLDRRARTDDGFPPTDIWENEGGSYSTADEPERAPDGLSCEGPRAGLDWHAFSTHSFPGRRRHDLEAVKAYEAYRSAGRRPRDHRRRTLAPYVA
jgi:hypothetical protein